MFSIDFKMEHVNLLFSNTIEESKEEIPRVRVIWFRHYKYSGNRFRKKFFLDKL